MKVEASKAEITRIKNELSPVEDRYHKLDSMYNQVTLLEKRIGKNRSYDKYTICTQRTSIYMD